MYSYNFQYIAAFTGSDHRKAKNYRRELASVPFLVSQHLGLEKNVDEAEFEQKCRKNNNEKPGSSLSSGTSLKVVRL